MRMCDWLVTVFGLSKEEVASTETKPSPTSCAVVQTKQAWVENDFDGKIVDHDEIEMVVGTRLGERMIRKRRAWTGQTEGIYIKRLVAIE